MVDSQSRRILILDENDAVTALVDVGSADSPAETIGDVCVSGDYIYAVGRLYGASGDLAAKEFVLKYDSRGTLVDEVYSV